MKAIEFQGILAGFTSKVDRSFSLRIATPELSDEQSNVFRNLQGINSRMLISPLDVPETGLMVVDKEVGEKTPSKRLRDVLYVLYTQQKPDIVFNTFYIREMEKIINHYKDKLI